MSGAQTKTTRQHARKRYSCDWCGETINAGDAYLRYRWFHYGDACKMHSECHTAMAASAEGEGGWIEWTPGDQERPVELKAKL